MGEGEGEDEGEGGEAPHTSSLAVLFVSLAGHAVRSLSRLFEPELSYRWHGLQEPAKPVKTAQASGPKPAPVPAAAIQKAAGGATRNELGVRCERVPCKAKDSRAKVGARPSPLGTPLLFSSLVGWAF